MNQFIRKKMAVKIAILSLLSTGLTTSWAIERQSPDFFQVGDVFLIPSLSVNTMYNDNLFLQDSQRKQSMVTTVNPRIRLAYEGEYSLTVFDANLNKGYFNDSATDNYLDSTLRFGSELFPSERIQYGFSFSRDEGHDNRGVGLQDGLSALDFNSPHQYRLLTALADFEYGTRVEGAARFEVAASLQDKKYENHRIATRILDREEGRLTIGLAYMLAPATSILIEGDYGDIGYDSTSADSKEYKAMVGLEWEATYQTTGFMKVGRSEKDFSDPTRSDSSEPAWEVGIDWAPLSYTTVTLRTAKGFGEGEGTGDFVNAETVSIDWHHDWYDHIGTRVKLGHLVDEYGGSVREDKVDSLLLGADYQYNPWLLISAAYTYEDRSSTLQGFDYKNSIISMHFKINL